MSEQIIATKDQIGSYDAIESLKPGEPVFPLQGGDPLAPLCTMVWAWKARRLARHPDTDEKTREKLLRKASMAEEVAWAMKDYQNGVGGPAISEVAEPPKTYSGIAAEKTGDWLPGIVAGVRHMDEAAASFSDAADHLPDDQASALRGVVAAINATAAKYQPKRASYPSAPEFPTA